jgi:predicted secreted protein
MRNPDELLDISVEVHVTVKPSEWEGADDDTISADIANRLDSAVRNSRDLLTVVKEFGGVEITYEERRTSE